MRYLLLLLPLLYASCAHPAAPSASWHSTIQIDATVANRAQIATLDGLFGAPPYTREQSFFALLNAPEFLPVGVGMDSSTSVLSVAFGTLLDQPDADAIFLDLTRRGTSAGKLYGLCGLYLIDRAAFDRVVQPFLTERQEVAIGRGGCMVGPAPTRDVVQSLTYPDIVRGGYPDSLRSGTRLFWQEHPVRDPN